ncbi:unnamed protein product [Amaranthus hypochondriacus]
MLRLKEIRDKLEDQGLQDENVRLKEISMQDRDEREVLVKKLQDMEAILRKNESLESSLLNVNAELQNSKKNTLVLQESCNGLLGHLLPYRKLSFGFFWGLKKWQP